MKSSSWAPPSRSGRLSPRPPATQHGCSPTRIEPDGPDTRAWDPPRHLELRQERGDWFNAIEFVIEGRHGGTSLLRYAHSGIFVDDWETQYDAADAHTDFYLHTLSEYLQHFDGRVATYIGEVPAGIQGPPSSATLDGFRRLQEALGLGAHLDEGGSVRLTPQGLDPIEGVLDYVRPNFIGVRTDHALYRFFERNAFGAPVAVSIHKFADGVEPEEIKHTWQDWLDTTLT
ncbi:MAG: SRPBCC domain-containing protein [Actinomycetota bacterium]|nr:SRPBCC domain-containing protein [Actinomycetota bacterium]